MRALGFVLVVLFVSGCSPLLALIVRAAESGGQGTISAGQSVSGSTVGAADEWQASCGSPQGGGDRAYVFVPEQSGTYRVEVNSSYDSVVAVFDQARQPLACNDDHGSASHSQIEHRFDANRPYTIVVDGYRAARGTFTLHITPVSIDTGQTPVPTALVLEGGVRREGNTAGQPDHRTPSCGSTPGSPEQTWTFTPTARGVYQIDVTSTFDAVLAVYPPGAAEPLACNDDHGSTRLSQVQVSLEAGVAYEVVVDGYHGATGTYSVIARATGSTAPPGVLALDTPVSGDTRSSSDSHQPGCGSQAGTPDQVWTFTAPRDAAYQFHVDADFDAVLAVYEANAPAPIQCNDDFGNPRQSRLVVPLRAGTAYQVVVDGFAANAGLYVLSAREATSGGGGGALTLGQPVSGDTSARTDTRTPSCGSTAGTPDETWTFVAPADGNYRIQMASDYDGVLALYAGARQIGCNDDFRSTRVSRIDAQLTAGQSYEIVVDGSQAQRGRYRLEVSALTAAPPTPVAPSAHVENMGALERRCASAAPLPLGQSTPPIASSEAHARTSCGSHGVGGEIVYRVSVQQPSTLTVTAETSLGPILELRSGCSRSHTVVVCDATNAPRARISAPLNPGQTYTLILDTQRAGDGSVVLDAQIAPVSAPP